MLKTSKIFRTSLQKTWSQLILPRAGILSSRFFSYEFDDKKAQDYLDTILHLNAAGFKAFSKVVNPQDRKMIQYVDLTPTLARILNNKAFYAHSLFAPRRFGKSVFLQMMSDFGMRTLKSAKEYYKDDLGHLQIFQYQDIQLLRGYDQPLFIPYIPLSYKNTFKDQQQGAFLTAADKFIKFRKKDTQEVVVARDQETKQMIDLCESVITGKLSKSLFVARMKNFQERVIILADEFDKALLPQEKDDKATSQNKRQRRQEVVDAILQYKNTTNIIVSGVLKLSQLGFNSGGNHFKQYVTEGYLGPQPLGHTKSRILSDKIQLKEMVKAAFEYRSSKDKPLHINISHLLPNVQDRYKPEDIYQIEKDGRVLGERLMLTNQNFIDVIFELFDGYRMTLDSQYLNEQTSIPTIIIWRSIAVVLNIKQDQFPVDLWTDSTQSSQIKEVVTSSNSQKMSLFQILKNNETVEIEQQFLRKSINAYDNLSENQLIRKRFISMLYYGGYLTIKDLKAKKSVILGPPNLTVYLNILKFFNNFAPMIILNQKLKLLCNGSKQISNKVWQDSLIAINQMQSGFKMFKSQYEKSRQINLTSNVTRVLFSHLQDFIVHHQVQTKSGKRPDIVIFQLSTNKPIIVMQYATSQFFSQATLLQHANRNCQDQYTEVKEQVTVLVDKEDMKTILMAVRKRRGSEQVEFIIDNRKTK